MGESVASTAGYIWEIMLLVSFWLLGQNTQTKAIYNTSQVQGTVHYSEGVTVAGAWGDCSLCVPSKESEEDEHFFFDWFLLFIGSIILVYWMSLLTFRISPSSLINLRQIIIHRHFPRFVCTVIVNLIELILKFNHQEKNYGKSHFLHTRDSDVPKLIL